MCQTWGLLVTLKKDKAVGNQRRIGGVSIAALTKLIDIVQCKMVATPKALYSLYVCWLRLSDLWAYGHTQLPVKERLGEVSSTALAKLIRYCPVQHDSYTKSIVYSVHTVVACAVSDTGVSGHTQKRRAAGN